MSAIVERFDRVRRGRPDRPLIHFPISGTHWTASDVWRRHLVVRDRLSSLGLQAHQLVISAVGNKADSLPLLLACRSIGATLMPVDADATRAEIFELAARFHSAAVVLPPPAPQDALSLVGDLSIVLQSDSNASAYANVAVMKLTSGSTGLAKAALTRESHLIADAQSIISAMGIEPDDIQIAAIPLSHSYGIGNLVMPLLLEGTAFVLRESFMPQHLPSDARTFGAGVFPGVPFMFHCFNQHPPVDGWPPRLQRLISAGASLDPAEANAFHGRFGVKIHSFYGTSETGGITYDETGAESDRPAAGRALPGVAITLRPAEGVSEAGGRVFVQSDAVCDGYAGIAAGDFENGGFLTGDYGEFDSDGRLILTGRVSSFVNIAGRKVQPQEIELVLRSMPGVADVRVLAAPDAKRGQQIAACLVTRTKMTTFDIRRYCAGRLAPYKIPRAVVFVEAIPLTARGKTDRRALDELVRVHLAGGK